MRWEAFFADLEASMAERIDWSGDVADVTRGEMAGISLADRLAAACGSLVQVHVMGQPDAHDGVVQDMGADWLLLDRGRLGREIVVTGAVRAISGLPRAADQRPGVHARRFGVGYMTRSLARSRVPVLVTDRFGVEHPGTIDRVGADFLEMAVHELDLPRRPEHVRDVRLLPVSGLATIRSR